MSSIVALVTLQADVANMGQILSGFALIDKVILNVRYLYAISHVSDAVEGPPSTPLVMFYVVSVVPRLYTTEADIICSRLGLLAWWLHSLPVIATNPEKVYLEKLAVDVSPRTLTLPRTSRYRASA